VTERDRAAIGSGRPEAHPPGVAVPRTDSGWCSARVDGERAEERRAGGVHSPALATTPEIRE